MKTTYLDDPDFYTCTVKSVRHDLQSESCAITTEDGWSIGWSLVEQSAYIAQVGDRVQCWPAHGTRLRGLVINGNVIWYRTEEEQRQDDLLWQAKQILQDKAKFEEAREELDRQYAGLPEVFRRRLDKFRTNNPDFRWKYEAYEMICCVDAVLIADTLKTHEAVEAFAKSEYVEQQKLVPGLCDGHSGNSFGMAVRLAWLYVTKPEDVIKIHGALAPLVGSKEYGCVPRESGGKDADA